MRRDIDDNGDLLVRRMGKAEVERAQAAAARSRRRPGSIPTTGGPRREAAPHHPARSVRHVRVRARGGARRMGGVRRVRVLRTTIRRRSKARRARRSARGFLGVAVARLVDAGADRRGERRPIARAAVETLAQQLVDAFRRARPRRRRVPRREEEFAFAASLCNHPLDTLIAVHRSSRTAASPRGVPHACVRATGAKPLRAFAFLEVEGEEEPAEQVDLVAHASQERYVTGRQAANERISGSPAAIICSIATRAADLLLTDEFLKVYLARPELMPPPEACAAERALHARAAGRAAPAGTARTRSPRSPTPMRARTGRSCSRSAIT